MNIGIIGLGVVGNAIYRVFKEFNINVMGYDINTNKTKNTKEEILKCDIVFISIPTLYDSELLEFDKTGINDICNYLEINKFKGLVVLKCTVEPMTTYNISQKYKINIVHNPEFLTARIAYEEFKNQKHIVIGVCQNSNKQLVDKLINFYKTYFSKAEISLCDSTESETMKIVANSFYAIKVQYFTEIYLLCKKLNINYDKVIDMIVKNGWMCKMHTIIPGPDGHISYGGMCFPKDTNSLLQFETKMHIPHSVLEGCIIERNSMRKEN